MSLVIFMEKKEDLRIIKTRKILYQTLIDLMKEKSFEEIKVSDICNRALINRSTFYSHYADKYELFSNYVNDLKDSLSEELQKNKNINNTKEYYLEMLKLFLNHLEEKKDIYASIMKTNRNSIIMYMIYDTFKNDITKEIEKDDNNKNSIIPSDFIAKFYLGCIFSIGMEILENTNKYTKEELIEYLNILIPKNLTKKQD